MKHGRRKPSLGRKILWVFLMILAFSSLRTWLDQEQESRSLDQKRQELQAKTHVVEAEMEALRDTLENITDDAHIEDMARKSLKMVHEDEWVLVDIQRGKEQ